MSKAFSDTTAATLCESSAAIAQIESALADVPQDTPLFLRRLIVELVILNPLKPADQKLLNYWLTHEQLNQDEKSHIQSLRFWADRRMLNVTALFAIIALASSPIVLVTLLAAFVSFNSPKLLIGFLFTVTAYVGLALLTQTAYRKQYQKRFPLMLATSDLYNTLSNGISSVTAIFDYAAQPWQALCLGSPPKNARGAATVLAKNIQWFLRPPKRFIPSGNWYRLLLSLPTIAVLILFFTYRHSLAPQYQINWAMATLCIVALTASLLLSLSYTYDQVATSCLISYLRTQTQAGKDQH